MKTQLNTTRVQLPDGTLLTIEGGNAADIAQMISNRLGGRPAGGELTSNAEPPLEMPSTHPGQASSQTSTVPAWLSDSAFLTNEEPLPLPTTF